MTDRRGAIRWFAACTWAGLFLTTLYLIFFRILSTPAFLIGDEVISEAVPFMWVAILAVAVGSVNVLKNTDEELVEEILELSRSDQLQFASIIFFMGAIVFSSLAILSGVGGYLIADAGSPVAGVVVAFVYPLLDRHLSDATGVSVGVAAGKISQFLLRVLSDLSVISTRALETAEQNAPGFTGLRRRPPGRTHT